jgi:hypothetical protein
MAPVTEAENPGVWRLFHSNKVELTSQIFEMTLYPLNIGFTAEKYPNVAIRAPEKSCEKC